MHGSIHVWRLADGAEVASYAQGVGLNVLSLAFRPDGKAFVFGREDGLLTLARSPATHVRPR